MTNKANTPSDPEKQPNVKKRRKKIEQKLTPDMYIQKLGVEAKNLPENPKEEEFITKLLAESLKNYKAVVEKEEQQLSLRGDFEALRNVATEFLNDFVIIGHAVNDQRVVIRYAATPGDLDKLTELSKKVLINMMIREERGSD